MGLEFTAVARNVFLGVENGFGSVREYPRVDGECSLLIRERRRWGDRTQDWLRSSDPRKESREISEHVHVSFRASFVETLIVGELPFVLLRPSCD
jgi:hypothetical protein